MQLMLIFWIEARDHCAGCVLDIVISEDVLAGGIPTHSAGPAPIFCACDVSVESSNQLLNF